MRRSDPADQAENTAGCQDEEPCDETDQKDLIVTGRDELHDVGPYAENSRCEARQITQDCGHSCTSSLNDCFSIRWQTITPLLKEMAKGQKLIYTDKGNENNDADHSVGNGRSLNGRPDEGDKRTHILKYTRARDNVASGAASEPASFPDEPRQGIEHNSKSNKCKK